MYDQTKLYRQRKYKTNWYELGDWTVRIIVVHAEDLEETLYYQTSFVPNDNIFRSFFIVYIHLSGNAMPLSGRRGLFVITLVTANDHLLRSYPLVLLLTQQQHLSIRWDIVIPYSIIILITLRLTLSYWRLDIFYRISSKLVSTRYSACKVRRSPKSFATFCSFLCSGSCSQSQAVADYIQYSYSAYFERFDSVLRA